MKPLLRATPAFLLAVLWALVPQPAPAQEEEDPSPHSEAFLVAEVVAIQPGTPFTVALRLEMEPGWHSYWRNPGDSGLPTTMEWALPPGFETSGIQWPYPKRIVVPPLVDYGYSDLVMLLVDVTPPQGLVAGSRVRLEARADWLICKEICLPAFQELALELPVTSEVPELNPLRAGDFREARSRLPVPSGPWSVETHATGTGYRLRVRPEAPGLQLPDGVYFFPALAEVLDHSAPQEPSRSGGALTLALRRSPYARSTADTLQGVLLAEGGGSWLPGQLSPALAVSVPVLEGPLPGEVPASGLTLVVALLFALAGGLLLNLMPCVFPILSLKALGMAGLGGEEKRRIRGHGLLFGLGVVLSFLALAGLLLLLRAGGAQLGWGFQLQSPLFVASMAALFFAIGLNLMGVFEVGGILTRLGGRLGAPSGARDALASGVLATVVATPCTAPFMGAALGFALTRSLPETLLIFGGLGVGMAVPYVLLSLAPGVLERLPRPGPWTETLRNLLAFPLFATVIWLVWVFGQQTGVGGAAHLLSALLLLSAAGWMVGRWHRTDLRSGVTARALSVALLLLGSLVVIRGAAAEPPLAGAGDHWRPFSQARADSLLSRGTPVFIDFTAAWCITCQVNERLVLSLPSVLEAFRSRGIGLLKADWTRQDPEITRALEGFGRNGVPLYVLLASPETPPRLLPAILTERIVLDALDALPSPPSP